MSAFTTLEQRENGDLAVVLTAEGREYLAETTEQDDENLLDYMLSDYLDKEWHLLTADQIGCLSEAPILTEELIYPDAYDDTLQVGDWWYFEPYQVRSVMDDLRRHGVAIFTKGA